MSSEVYKLEGSALFGIEPTILPAAALLEVAAAAEKPVEVRLGARLDEAFETLPGLRLSSFFDPAKATLKLPEETRWREKARASLSTMLANDRYGCCVISGSGHAAGVWTANDGDSGGEAVMTDAECVQQYRAICGPGDNGCYIPSVLNWWQQKGLQIGGKNRRIAGWLKIDWRNHDLVKAAIHCLGGVKIGFRCPPAFLRSATWDYVGPVGRSWGGHDAPPVDYTATGPISSSWGRLYQWDWKAWDAYLTECYAVLSPDWYGDDTLAPSGFKVDELRKALEAFGRGDLPPDPSPVPEPPPVPPSPDQVTVSLSGTFHGILTPVRQPDELEVDCRGCADDATPAVMAMLESVGSGDVADAVMECTRVGQRLRLRRPQRLTPDQWASLVALVLELIRLIREIRKGRG